MAYTVTEITHLVEGKETSYEPKRWLVHYTMKRPNLDITTTLEQDTKPKVGEVYATLVSRNADVLSSALAMLSSSNEHVWSFLYQYIPPIRNTTYFKGDSGTIELNGIRYIVVFLHPVTIIDGIDYSKMVSDGHIRLISQQAGERNNTGGM